MYLELLIPLVMLVMSIKHLLCNYKVDCFYFGYYNILPYLTIPQMP